MREFVSKRVEYEVQSKLLLIAGKRGFVLSLNSFITTGSANNYRRGY